MRTTIVINKMLATDAAMMTGSMSSAEVLVDELEEEEIGVGVSLTKKD